MDKWMADDTLNANTRVRTWHEKAQRCGFKFLVVQIVGAAVDLPPGEGGWGSGVMV